MSQSSRTPRARPTPAGTPTDQRVDSGPRLRADARRNRELILAAADAAFAEEGLGVPVDEISRRAGVGPGTLYRHFPTKEALFEAVLVAHMERLARFGQELADREKPDEALFEFVGRLASEAASKRNLIDALSGAGHDIKTTSSESRAALEDVLQLLLSRAQSAGLVRSDVQPADLMALVMGACAQGVPESTECSQQRILAVVCAGLKAGAGLAEPSR
jgi:AcrR family transcriptional regulator